MGGKWSRGFEWEGQGHLGKARKSAEWSPGTELFIVPPGPGSKRARTEGADAAMRHAAAELTIARPDANVAVEGVLRLPPLLHDVAVPSSVVGHVLLDRQVVRRVNHHASLRERG